MMQNSLQHSAKLGPDGNLLAVHVPMTFKKRGGRKVIVTPNGAKTHPQPYPVQRSGIDTGLVQVLSQAFRWQRMLDDGRFATIGDLAQAEKHDRSFVSRMLRLTLLAPDIVEAILNGKQPARMQQQALLHGFPLHWSEQREWTKT